MRPRHADRRSRGLLLGTATLALLLPATVVAGTPGAAGAAGPAAATVATAAAADADLGRWTLNERGQRVRDRSGEGNHGHLGRRWKRDAADPKRVRIGSVRKPRALRFDGRDYVRIRDAAALEPDGVTIAARVKASKSPGRYRYIVAKGALKCRAASYGLYTGNRGGLRFYVSDRQDFHLSSNRWRTKIWDGRWHTVVGTYDGAELTLTVDGETVGQPTTADLDIAYGLPDGDELYFGGYAGDCGKRRLGFKGTIDAVAVRGAATAPTDAARLVAPMP